MGQLKITISASTSTEKRARTEPLFSEALEKLERRVGDKRMDPLHSWLHTRRKAMY